MKTSVKLALRASEIRQKINELPVDDAEKRSALLAELSTVETEFRSSLTAEAAEDAAAPSGEGLSAEERARRQLENRAELRQALHCVMNERALTGAEAELQQAVGLSGHSIPWELLAPRHVEAGGAEHRVDAVGGAVAAGRWKATAKATVPKTRGYHLDCFSGSAFETLDTIHRAWTRATEHRKATGSLKEIIDFQMGRRALPYNPIQNNGVSPDSIMQTCRRDYDAGVVPDWASLVTVAVDTQDDRLEAEVSAWGALKVGSAAEATELAGWSDSQFKGISWRGDYYRLKRAGLSYHRLYGDPGAPDVWERLAELCEAPLPHESGPVMRPAVIGIDSGGHHSNDVAEFVKSRGGGYQALKGLGQHRHEGVIARRSTTIDALEAYGPAGLLLVSTNSAKASVFSMLRQAVAGDDPHLIWPLNEDHYGPEEYAGVCSEILTRQINKQTGQTQQVWKKVGRYNEALDLLTYSLALIHHVGIGFLISQAEAIARAAEQEKAA